MRIKTVMGVPFMSADIVTPDMLRAWKGSDDLRDNWLAYETLTGKPVEGYVPSQSDTAFILEYLLACITADLGWDLEDDVPHNKPEALWELQMPLVDIWKEPDSAMPPDAYWRRIERFLLFEHDGYDDAFVTHFLEGCQFDTAFIETMRRWRKTPGLEGYVENLIKIVGDRFG